MMLMNLLALLIFTVILLAVLLIPLLHAVGAYDDRQDRSGKRVRTYSVLFDVSNPSRIKEGHE